MSGPAHSLEVRHSRPTVPSWPAVSARNKIESTIRGRTVTERLAYRPRHALGLARIIHSMNGAGN